MAINYIKGDATYPKGPGLKVIVHCCNDIGKWGKGFVLAISKRWRQPRESYLRWAHEVWLECVPFRLGEVLFVKTDEPDIIVANLIGQRGIWQRDQVVGPIQYGSIEKGLIKVADYCLKNNASVHMPRIGCGLAGGEWSEIEQIIKTTLLDKNINVIVYDLH